MDKELLIEVKDISKKFIIKSPSIHGGLKKNTTVEVFNNISFSVYRGEIVGLIGKNGSGKSTILKILANIMAPDQGSVTIKGAVASILELSMGFEPEATGRDNIYFKCGLYGLNEKKINSICDSIINFSELGNQIDYPLNTYSSGMKAKLAFSILIHINSPIFVIDEVLSVTDASFNAKCKTLFEKMKKKGQTVIIASHNLNTLESICDRVIWIGKNGIKSDGLPQSVCYQFEYEQINSFETVQKNANDGDVLSMIRLGVMYRDGIQIEQNQEMAEEWFLKASEYGNVDALINLANIKSNQGDYDHAKEYYLKAAERGSVVANSYLIQLEEYPHLIENLKSYLLNCLEKGNNRAIKMLADMHYNGDLIPKDEKSALIWFKKSAETGDVTAQYTLGVMYKEGIGTTHDIQNAIYWLEKASSTGHIKAIYELANIYRKGINIQQNMDKAIEWYKRAAEYGDLYAMYTLGTIYQNGIGVERNESESKRWYNAQFSQVVSNYEYTIADILINEDKNLRDQALWLLEDSAKRGNIKSLGYLAELYRSGSIIPVNMKKSLELYSILADRNQARGLFETGIAYLNGTYISQDYSKALYYLQKSSELGFHKAKLQLASMYYMGQGVPVNVAEAHKLLKELLEYGNDNAKILHYNNEGI